MTAEPVPMVTAAPVAAPTATAITTPPESDKSPEDGEDCGCGDETKVAPTANSAPTASELKKIDDLPLLDAEENKRSFRSVYASPDADKHLVIFVRHFFCGNCQEFIRHLSAHLPPSSLPPRTAITLISNGTPSLLPAYISTTGSAYPVFTDPDRALYIALQLGRSKAMGPKKPEYIKQSLFASILGGIAQGLSSGRNALKGGDFWQIGGEFLFVRKGDSWEVEWCHRMRTTRDHAEVSELRQILGMDSLEKGSERDSGWKNGVQELGKWRNAQRNRSKSMKGSRPATESEGSPKGKERTVDVPGSTKLDEGKEKAAEVSEGTAVDKEKRKAMEVN